MNIKELITHVNDNIQNERDAGEGLLYKGKVSTSYATASIVWEAPAMYELAPKTVLINDIECSAGMTEAPKNRYFTPEPSRTSLCQLWCWFGDSVDHQHLDDMLVFPDTVEGESNAIAMAKAMLNFGEVT